MMETGEGLNSLMSLHSGSFPALPATASHAVLMLILVSNVCSLASKWPPVGPWRGDPLGASTAERE